MKRILALVAAVAMVAGAWSLRQSWDEGGGVPVVGSRDPLAVICATELRAVCDALEDEDVTVTVEEAGVTAERLAQEPRAGADGWVTLRPWPQMVSDRRARGGLDPLGEPSSAVLARSPLVLAVWQERAAVLEDRCRDGLRWRCVGQLSGRPWAGVGGEAAWGNVKPGYPDPATSATGLLVLGHAATDFLGTADFSTRDLDSDEFLAWLVDLAAGVPSAGATGPPVQQMLQFGPARFDVVGVTEAEAATRLERSQARRGTLGLHYPERVAVAEAVLAPLGDDRGERLREVVWQVGGPALAQAGWRVQGAPLAAGVSEDAEVPDDAGLPSAGALEALRQRYGEISR